MTEQVEVSVVAPLGARAHLFGAVNAPVPAEKFPTPVEEKATVPVGLDLVPPALSLTSTEHVVESFTDRLAGEQLTVVTVARVVTVSVVPVLSAESAKLPVAV